MDILRVLMQTLCDALGATFSDDDLLSDRIHQNLQLRFKAAAAKGIQLFIVLDGVDHLQVIQGRKALFLDGMCINWRLGTCDQHRL